MKKRVYISLFAAFVLLFSFNRVSAQIKPETMRQIQSLLDEKASRTPAQRKMQSSLLQAAREHIGQKMALDVNLQPAQVNANASGTLSVDIDGNVTDALLAKIKALGGEIIYPSKEYKTVRARVNLNDVEKIAAFPEVTFIQPAATASLTGSGNPKQNNGKSISTSLISKGLSTTAKRAITERREKLSKKVADYVMMLGAGTVSSEGDHAHRADEARNKFGYAGQGIKIGIMSDSYNSAGTAAGNVLNGNLPGPGNPVGNTTPVTVLVDYAGGTDEGQAMVQIVHDLVPKAQLFFATAYNTAAQFAANIKALRAAGCDVIIDDVSYSNEPAFQDGIIAQAVNFVTNDGAMYFSSAGNAGSLLKGSSGVYEGDFNSTGSPTFAGATKAGGSIHNFGTGTLGNVIKAVSSQSYNLMWADPIGKSTNDYDLFLVSSTGTVKSSSTTTQAGASDPYEQIATATLVAGDQLVVFKAGAAAIRAFALNANRGALTVATTGQTHGHASAANAFCVAAAPANTPFNAASATGPFPGFFTAANQLENFSSDGPRRIFFNADSTPVSAGNFTFASNGFVTRAKPDITAADGVVTSVPGFIPFYGTSAAAPHAGAIAALIKSANPALTTAQIRTILTSSALDIEGPGYDINSGSGIVMAYQALQYLNTNISPITPMASISFGTVGASESTFSNNNGVLEPGEVGNVFVQLNNSTATTATNITATLTTSTPGVNISTGSINYGSLAGGASITNTANPFKVGITSSVACGSTITFYLAVNFGGGTASPVGYSFTITVGPTLTLGSTSSSLGSPGTGAGFTSTTGTQIGRMSRITTGVTSTCAAPFANPGLTVLTGARQYDAYTFTNTTGASQCFTATITASNTLNNMYSTAYNNSGFVPANPALNYIGEPAQTTPVYQYSFNVNAGEKFTVVVSAVDSISNPGGNEIGTAYTIGVTYISCSTPPVCTPVTITTASLASGATGVYYSQKITATGGSGGAFVDSVIGTLPAGISFAGDSLYGTPTQAGTFPISIKVTSATGCSSATANFTLTIAGIAPAAVTATAGTPQTTIPGTVFATALKAKVTDASNNPLPGVNVVFTAPTTGATGTFTGGLSTVTVVTDASGIATAPTFTSNTTTGAYNVTATVVGVATPAIFALTNTCPPTIVTSGGDTGPGTLRTIIANACVGATITFDPSVTTISLTNGEIAINKAVTITGNGANVTSVSAGGLSRVFNITGGTATININGITIKDGKVAANSTLGGAGLLINSGVVIVANSIISNNDASLMTSFSDGGGIYNSSTLATTFDHCTISGNKTDRLGAGIAQWGTGTMTVTNSTITGNISTGTLSAVGYAAGAFYNGPIVITNSTVFGNTAYSYGGNLFKNTSGTLTLGNSIVAGGIISYTAAPPVGNGLDIYGAFTSTGYNIIQNVGGYTLSGTTTGNQLGVNPKLLPLANYGGTTPTFLPMSSSTAVNASNPALTTGTDQRGNSRYIGGRADIGAVETNYTATITAGTPQTTPINNAFPITFKETVTESGNPVAGDSVTFTAPASGASGTFTGGLRIAGVVTNASGLATAPAFTANGTMGTYNVTGSIGSAFTPLNFVLTNSIVPIAFTGCPNINLVIARPGYNTYNGEGVMMYNMDTTNGATTVIPGGPLKDSLTGRNIDVNGAGVNAQDGFVYAIRDTINTAGTAAAPMFYRIGSNYATTLLGTLPASPLLTSAGENLSVVIPSAGSFDDLGNYYYVAMSGAYSFIGGSFTPSNYYVGKLSNVAGLTPSTSQLTASFTKVNIGGLVCAGAQSQLFKTITASSGAGAGTSFQDMAYSNLYKSLYVYVSYKVDASYSSQLIGINPTTGGVTCYSGSIPLIAGNNEVAGILTTAGGGLEVLMTGGDIYKASIINTGAGAAYTSTLTKIGTSGITPLGVTGSIRGDLASCNVGPTTLPTSTVPSSIVVSAPNQITAYPNPAQGLTTISVGLPLSNATVRLLGATGNIITERSGVSGYTFQMDMTGKAGGMYTVEVIQGGNSQVVKIIKP